LSHEQARTRHQSEKAATENPRSSAEERRPGRRPIIAGRPGSNSVPSLGRKVRDQATDGLDPTGNLLTQKIDDQNNPMKTKPSSNKAKSPKTKTQVKIRDLKPQKDAKGGLRRTGDPCDGGE
jgi:hypothetical protein